jgi:hypothetical protein
VLNKTKFLILSRYQISLLLEILHLVSTIPVIYAHNRQKCLHYDVHRTGVPDSVPTVPGNAHGNVKCLAVVQVDADKYVKRVLGSGCSDHSYKYIDSDMTNIVDCCVSLTTEIHLGCHFSLYHDIFCPCL